MKCYFCPLRIEPNQTAVAVGWAKQVHETCYESYLRYIKQIKEAHAPTKA